MKIDRHGRAKILDPGEIQLLFTQGLQKQRDRVLFGILLFSACRHSFRRTALTQMSNTGTRLKVIAEVSGHRNLSQLNAYFEVKPEQVLGSVASLSILAPVGEGGKRTQL